MDELFLDAAESCLAAKLPKEAAFCLAQGKVQTTMLETSENNIHIPLFVCLQ